MINLLDLGQPHIRQFFLDHGEKAFHGDQVLKWMHQLGVVDFAAMTNLSRPLRSKLSEIATITIPEIASEQISNDGTRKWLLRLDDGNCIETVFIPERTRGTLCVSSQVGCGLNCTFCATGKQGFSRNLTVAEIIGQLWLATRRLAVDGTSKAHAISNVVMMGMGEPLLNFDAVLTAMDLMMNDLCYGLSKYRVTLSTSGLIPAILKLKASSPVALAVSLHAPNDALRNQLVPLNKKYGLGPLMQVCRDYFPPKSKRKVTFEYVMLAGVNDSDQHARELIQCIKQVPCKLNLIPFNPFPYTEYHCSSPTVIERFQKRLMAANINTIVRRTRGDDIDAACGQLVGNIKDRTQRRARWLRQRQAIFPIQPVGEAS